MKIGHTEEFHILDRIISVWFPLCSLFLRDYSHFYGFEVSGIRSRLEPVQSSDQCKAVLPLLQRLKRQLSSASLQRSLPSIYTWKIFQKYLPSNLFNCAIVFCKTDQVYPFVVVFAVQTGSEFASAVEVYAVAGLHLRQTLCSLLRLRFWFFF